MAAPMPGSACDGRGTQCAYFESWQATTPSKPAMCRVASTRAVVGSSKPWAAIAARARAFQTPAAKAPVRFSQFWATRSCSAVRVSATVRTAASCALKASEPQAGGAGARNSSPDFSRNVRVPPSAGASGGAGGCTRLAHLSSPTGRVPAQGWPMRSVRARAVTSAPAWRPRFTPAWNAARVAGPMACTSRCSRAVVAASSFGNVSVSTVAAAPAAAPSDDTFSAPAFAMALWIARFM